MLGLVLTSGWSQGQSVLKGIKSNYDLPGQMAPPEMVFVPGNDSTPSFYISRILEPNINYVIYLKWLRQVHTSNPIAFFEALPKDSSGLIDEDFIRTYLLNPDYALNPITGLSWLQIQDYLHWKTDRLNEAILVEIGALREGLTNQFDQDCFNTEAFLNHQARLPRFKGLPRQGEMGNARYFTEGIFFTGYRLATLEESRYYSATVNENWPEWTKYEWNDKASWSAFLSEFDRDVQRRRHDYRLYSSDTTLVASYDLDNPEFIRSCWLLNDMNHLNSNWLKAYHQSGFAVLDSAVLRNVDGTLCEKDSMGRMRDFRYIGIDQAGAPLPVGFDPAWQKVKVKADSSYYWEIPDSIKSMPLNDSVWVNDYFERAVINFRSGQIRGIGENESPKDIGFVCVLPYVGAPVPRKYRVKWKY